MLGFTNEELAALTALAAAVPPRSRGDFLRAVAAKLAALPLGARGPGVAHQVAIAAQRDFLKGGTVAVGPGTEYSRGGRRAALR